MASQDRSCVGVLCSAGVDSVVLVAEAAQRAEVQPIYVAVGLAWEAAERRALDRVVAAMAGLGRIRAPHVLEMSMLDVYPPAHWALQHDPAVYRAEEDVYIVGRNLTLLAKAAVFCTYASIHEIALGPLAGNPYPDATPEFFDVLARALSIGLAHEIRIATPFRDLPKSAVLRLGTELGVPLDLTLSCTNPIDGRHCGLCSKCRERYDAFVDAGLADPTDYVARRG